MKTITLLSGICAFVLVPFGAAMAGACSAEIENVNKLLASRDAGSGPTTGAAATSAGQHPPASAMQAEDASTAASTSAESAARPQHPPAAATNQAPGGGSSAPQQRDSAPAQHPPTAAMNQATQGGAASPQDVQSQTRGGPTAAQQAEGRRSSAGERIRSAEAALEEARGFDRSGQEAQCIEAIERAKVLAR
jgi:hypothetical protein